MTGGQPAGGLDKRPQVTYTRSIECKAGFGLGRFAESRLNQGHEFRDAGIRIFPLGYKLQDSTGPGDQGHELQDALAVHRTAIKANF